ncbi:hypothetical protein CBR_g17696 [Chara braunii]|uniref:EF-hand domain-containing protein n=1 Tax=Chara braunii TaxID=69332 RepID=A0A388KV94_CHABU|nr:hypothetical protein CBR_g17696 [Chara braunii]|eukprot:GBG73985.1 hypothetical protein CBR_g17696 [Chara braunii]
MGVVFLDGSTIRAFVNKKEAFARCVDEIFHGLDVDGDDVLSKSEMRPALENVSEPDLQQQMLALASPSRRTMASRDEERDKFYDRLFERFDQDHNGVVDKEEFLASEREILLAIADGLGDVPISMVVEDKSLLQSAADMCCPPSPAQASLNAPAVSIHMGGIGSPVQDRSRTPSLFGNLPCQLPRIATPTRIGDPSKNSGVEDRSLSATSEAVTLSHMTGDRGPLENGNGVVVNSNSPVSDMDGVEGMDTCGSALNGSDRCFASPARQKGGNESSSKGSSEGTVPRTAVDVNGSAAVTTEGATAVLPVGVGSAEAAPTLLVHYEQNAKEKVVVLGRCPPPRLSAWRISTTKSGSDSNRGGEQTGYVSSNGVSAGALPTASADSSLKRKIDVSSRIDEYLPVKRPRVCQLYECALD